VRGGRLCGSHRCKPADARQSRVLIVSSTQLPAASARSIVVRNVMNRSSITPLRSPSGCSMRRLANTHLVQQRRIALARCLHLEKQRPDCRRTKCVQISPLFTTHERGAEMDD
jgi:hypothetical protein